MLGLLRAGVPSLELLTAKSDRGLVEVAVRHQVEIPQEYGHLLPPPPPPPPDPGQWQDDPYRMEPSYKERPPRRVRMSL